MQPHQVGGLGGLNGSCKSTLRWDVVVRADVLVGQRWRLGNGG